MALASSWMSAATISPSCAVSADGDDGLGDGEGHGLIGGQDGADADDLARRVRLTMLAALADAACWAATAN